MTAEATVACPDGCFEVTFEGHHDTIDDQRFVDDLGVPVGIIRNGNTCPACGAPIDVTRGAD